MELVGGVDEGFDSVLDRQVRFRPRFGVGDQSRPDRIEAHAKRVEAGEPRGVGLGHKVPP
jgi:hypothetical protein